MNIQWDHVRTCVSFSPTKLLLLLAVTISTCALEAGAISGHPHKTRHPFVAPGCQLLTDTSKLEQHKRLDFKGALTELNDTGDPSSLNLNNSLDVVFLFDVLVPNGNALSCFEFKLELRNTLEG